MDYKVEEISAVERKVEIEVPAEEVNAAISAAVALYKMRTDIKGFRKGKAPANIIEGRFHKQIYGEATTDLINFQINDVMGKLGVQPLSRIDVDAKELVRDEDFKYSITFEVAPTLDLPEYKGLKVEEEAVAINEDEIKEVEARILQNAAEVKVIEDDREPKDGEVVTVSFGAYQDGKLVEGIKAENFDMALGEEQALPEFEEAVKTLKVGEDAEKDITFPADFINNNLAGQTVTMKIKLHAIKERTIPELTDEVAMKAGGFESVEKMREVIAESYTHSRKELVRSDSQKTLLKGLLDSMEFDLPPSMVEDRTMRLIQDLAHRLEQQGKSIESTGKSLEQLQEEMKPEAVDTVRSEIFLLAVAKNEDLDISNSEIDAHLTQVAMQTRQPLHELKKYYEDNNLIMPLKDRMLCDKAMGLIYDAAEVTEVEGKAAPKKAAEKPAKKAAKEEAPKAEGGAPQFANKAEAVKFAMETLGLKESTAKGYSQAKLQERADKWYAENK